MQKRLVVKADQQVGLSHVLSAESTQQFSEPPCQRHAPRLHLFDTARLGHDQQIEVAEFVEPAGRVRPAGPDLDDAFFAAQDRQAVLQETLMRFWHRCRDIGSAPGSSCLIALARSRVDQRAQTRQQRITACIAHAIAQVESVVKGRGIAALVVLDHGFELVQTFDELRLRRQVGIVFVPRRHDARARRLRQRCKQGRQVPALARAFDGGIAVCRGRDVAADPFAEVVQQAKRQDLFEVHAGQFVPERDREQGETPAMFGRALRPACRAVPGTQCVLESFGTLDEGQVIWQMW